MARTDLTINSAPGSYPTAGVVLTLDAADAVNLNSFSMTGRELLVAFNSDTAVHTVTISSVADEKNRTGDITAESIAAGAYAVYGPFKNKAGWAQATGKLFVAANDATVKFCVIRLPS